MFKKLKIKKVRFNKKHGTFLGTFVVLGIGAFLFTFLTSAAEPPWAPTFAEYTKRQRLTVTNNSTVDMSANTAVAITIDTQSLVSQDLLQPDCDDLRVVYQPNSSTSTELSRHLVTPENVSCSVTGDTKVYFPLQAGITASASSTAYYIYYANATAPAVTSTDNAFNIGTTNADLVCPFNGSTDCSAGETNSAATPGPLRYSGSKSAMSFDGFDDHLVAGSDTSIDDIPSNGQITVEFWYKPKVWGKYWTNIVGKGQQGGGTLSSGWSVMRVNDNSFAMKIDNATTNADLDCRGFVTVGNWHHIALSYDDTGTIWGNRIPRAFVNGIEITNSCSGKVAGVGDYGSDAAYDLRAGGSDNGWDNHFEMDDLRVSNTIRYTSNFTPPTAPHVRDDYTKLLYHFDENGLDPRNSGTYTAFDDSGNSNHGVLTGTPKYISDVYGIDNSSANTGLSVGNNPYAGHEGIFIGEATTNKITNPSFEHATYNTGWTASGGTSTENTTSTFNRFGSKSYKLVLANSTDQTLLTSINPGNTNTHTLSAFVFRGTANYVGGTVDATIAQLVFRGTAQTTTYTDMGSGWWRLSYSGATANSAENYGIQLNENSGTMYFDGFQLEQKNSPTTYTDGSITPSSGTTNSYFWDDDCDGTLDAGENEAADQNAQCSSRLATNITYSDTISSTEGTISVWFKPEEWVGTDGNYQYIIGASGAENLGGIAWDSSLFRFYNNAGNANDGLTTVAPVIGKWHHIVATWSGTSATIYVNNTTDGTNTSYNSANWTPTSLDVGKRFSNSTNYAGGVVSDLRVFDSSVTATEVSELYSAGLVSHSKGNSVDRYTEDKGQNPIAIYHFNEASGTVAYDSAPGQHNLNITSATWDASNVTSNNPRSTSLNFNGTSAYLSRIFDKDFNFGTDDFTIAGWIKHPSGSPTAQQNIVSRYGTAGYKVYLNSSGYICFGIDDDNSWGPDYEICGNSTLYDSNWHHFEAVKTSTSLTIYVDGRQMGTNTSLSSPGSLNSTSTLYIGVDSTGNSNYYSGFIDELYFYPSARTAAQVKSDYEGNQTSSILGSLSQDSLSQGLVGYWKMDEASSPSIDSSGNGNNGTWSNNTQTIGKFGNSALFDNSADYINVGSSTSIDNVANWTASFWLYPTNLSPGFDARFFCKGIGCTGSNKTISMVNGGYIVASQGWNGGADANSQTSTTLTLNTWNHVVVVADSTTRYTKIYFNGIEQPYSSTTQGNNSTLDDDSADDLYIGNRSGADRAFPGRIDEIRFYNSLLTTSEINQLYAFTPGPIAHWKLDDNSGTTASDSSGNGKSLTLTNNPTWSLGKYGNGINFNAANAQLIRADDADLDFADDASATWQIWFKHTTASAQQILLSKYNEAGYKIIMESDGDITCALDYDSTWTPTDSITSTAANYDDNNWHHVSCVKNGATSLSLYIDGVLIESDTTLTATNTLTNSDPLYIGINADGSSNDFVGSLDDIRIYNYARTPAQIVADLNAGHPAPGSPVGSAAAHWRFDSFSPTQVFDSGPNSQHLTISGSPEFTPSGKLGHAVDLESTSAPYLYTADTAALSITSDLATSAWIKPESVTASTVFHIAGKWDTDHQDYLLSQYGDEIRMYIGSTSNYVTTNAVNLQTGTWYHVLGSYNATAQTVTIYINGRPVPTTVSGTIPASIANNDGQFSIGAAASLSPVVETIGGDTDDGLQNATTWLPSGDGTNTGFGYSSGAAHAGVRFQTVAIANSASIASAYLRVYSEGVVGTLANVQAAIVGDDSDSAAAWRATLGACGTNDCPSTISNYTTAQVQWNPSVWTADTYYDSPDISSIISEIVSRPGWSSGNNLRLAILYNGSTSSGSHVAAFDDYAGVTKNVAQLTVNFTGSNPYDGLIDEVKIYSSNLTAAQVLIEYNQSSSQTLGSLTTNTSQVGDYSAAGSYCVPGDATSCTPPIGHWRLDENTGTTSQNIGTTASINAALTGATWRPGKLSQSLYFNGDDYAELGASQKVSNSQTGTIQAWIKLDHTASTQTIFGYGGGATSNPGRIQLFVGYSPGSYDYLSFTAITDGEAISSSYQSGSTALSTNTWYHVAVVSDGSTTSLYLNGKKEALNVDSNNTGDWFADTTVSGTDGSAIGALYANGTITDYLSGNIDDLRIYEYVRAPAQIAWDYSRGSPVAWYKFDESTWTNNCSTATVFNSVAHSDHGISCPNTTGQTTPEAGRFSTAMHFDDSNDYVSVTDSSTFDLTSGLTISAWVNTDANEADNVIISKGTSYEMGINADGDVYWDGVGAQVDDGSARVQFGSWHHVVITNNDTTATYYVDGIQTGTSAAGIDVDNSTALYIGYDGTNYFDGLIDQVQIFNYPLTSAQVKTVYNNSSAVQFR